MLIALSHTNLIVRHAITQFTHANAVIVYTGGSWKLGTHPKWRPFQSMANPLNPSSAATQLTFSPLPPLPSILWSSGRRGMYFVDIPQLFFICFGHIFRIFYFGLVWVLLFLFCFVFSSSYWQGSIPFVGICLFTSLLRNSTLIGKIIFL